MVMALGRAAGRRLGHWILMLSSFDFQLQLRRVLFREPSAYKL
jgi:hypothetical protein